MMLENGLSKRTALAVATGSLITFSAAGQSLTSTNATGQAGWHLGATADYSYVTGGGAKFQGRKVDSDAQSVNAGAMVEIPVTGQWFIPVRVTSHNLFPGPVTGMPIPGEIHTLGFNPGVGYHFNDQWTVVASVGPRFYRLNDVGGDTIGLGGMVMGSYRWKPELALAAGLGFEPANEVPVLPFAGLEWDFQPDWTLDLMWPRTALIYRGFKPLDLYAGASGNMTVFRANADMGNQIGQPAYNNALGTYRDFHLGIGAAYRFCRGFSLEVEGGYSVGREINYTRLNQTVSFDPSPYVQAGLRLRF